MRGHGAVGSDAGAHGVRVQREGERQAVGEGRGGSRRGMAGGGGGGAAEAEEGGAGLGVGLECLGRGRERRAVRQTELEGFQREG